MLPMRALTTCVVVAAALSACDGPVSSVPTVPVEHLETSFRLSTSTVSRAHPPERLVATVRIRNPFAFKVQVAPESSYNHLGDAFTGYGLRFSFVTTRVDEHGGLGAYAGMYPGEIFLFPGQSFSFEYDVGTLDGAPANWEGRFVIHGTLQGDPLPLLSFRVVP